MSKLLVQSRTFLPMVINKSTPLDKFNMLQTHPAVSPKLEHPLEEKSPEKEILNKKEQTTEGTIKGRLMQTNLTHSDGFTITVWQERTLFQALKMDLMGVGQAGQEWLAKLLARVHMWLFRKELGLLRGEGQRPTPSPTMVFLEGRPRVKEEEPNPILLELPKNKPMKQRQPENYAVQKEEAKSVPQKSDTKSPPMKSHFVDSVIERAPEWQKSISANLGALQKKVVEKLPK